MEGIEIPQAFMCMFAITNLLYDSEQHFDTHSRKSQREELYLFILHTLGSSFLLIVRVCLRVCVYFLIPERVKQPKQPINPMCECFSK